MGCRTLHYQPVARALILVCSYGSSTAEIQTIFVPRIDTCVGQHNNVAGGSLCVARSQGAWALANHAGQVLPRAVRCRPEGISHHMNRLLGY